MINNQPIRIIRIACFIAAEVTMLAVLSATAQARDYFNPALLEIGSPDQVPSDLSAFENKGGQLPGTYHVAIYLNNNLMDTREVEFRMMQDANDKSTLQPCLTVDELASWGVETRKFPQLGAAGTSCANLSTIPQAQSNFRFSKQQLLLSIPQSAVNSQARGWVDPKQWDDGIPAAILNYSVSGANTYAKNGADDDSQYINLRPGLNFGPWRLRNYTTWNRNNSGGESTSHWDTVYTYLQRDIKRLKSQLTLGDSTSPADVFDSIPFRGVQLASDDDMLPESLRGYAPSVRGIARTNAQVTIRQNGYVIYQTYVSPGSFEITDMYPTGGSGDLNVTIKESDGSEQHLIVPYASLPVLQREGHLKYSITSAAYRSYDSNVHKTPFTQGTFIYGLDHGFTGYGGGQFASRYQSLAIGMGKNLGDAGAFSIDMTQAWSNQQDNTRINGRSFRMRYSKNFLTTGTNFAIAGYRYATSGYFDMQEVLDTYRDDQGQVLLKQQRRNRAEMTMTQNLGDIAGSLALTAIWEDYWGDGQSLQSYGATYNNSWDGISYGLSYSWNYNTSGQSTGSNQRSSKIYRSDQLFSFNISVPLDRLFGTSHPMYANYMLNSSKSGYTTNNLTVGGTALADNNLSWSVQQGYGNRGQGNNGSVSADWRATYGEMTSGYSYDRNSQRLNYGLQGGVLAHSEGVTLSQPLGETIALVKAPQAKEINVLGQTGVRTDFRGYAVVPYVSPYRKNDISLDTETFGDDTEVAITTRTVIPTRGAVVEASYQTSVGKRMLLTLTQRNGRPVPFGAIVTDPLVSQLQGFIVGEGGQVYLTGLAETGTLAVKWGDEASTSCAVNYQTHSSNGGIQISAAKCQ